LIGTKRIVLRVTASLIAGVGSVCLSSFYVRLHINWRNQAHVVTERRDLARPIMRTAARLQSDQTRRKLLEKAQDLRSTQFPIEDRRALGVGAVNLKNVLGQIQADGGNLLHGTAPYLVALPATTTF
jgi:hypothetical protein